MAINPISDLVLDVANAAPPERVAAATAKLVRMGDAAGTAFADAARPSAQSTSPATASRRLDASSTPLPGAIGEWPLGFRKAEPSGFALFADGPRTGLAGGLASSSPAPDARAKVYQRFEAFVLQSFLQSMLPSNDGDFYGKGVSGDIWRSMLAEQLGAGLASHGGIGIADRLQATRRPA